MANTNGTSTHSSSKQRSNDEARKRMVAGAMEVSMSEKSPDDFSFEGGNNNETGPSRGSAGDLRTLAAKDNPDDLEEEPYHS